MLPDLFADDRAFLPLDPGAVLLGGFALADAPALLDEIALVAAQAPFRHLITPGGRRMSVAMTNCGTLGWTSDARGYRYAANDPETHRAWPAMPACFAVLARTAAERAGYPGFMPDVCLINRYEPGTRLSLHQDRDEGDMAAPIVSVSLGLSATFLWGGPSRSDRPRRIALHHGDVMVWGGPSRLVYHGVDPVEWGVNPATEGVRLNMTFRKAR
jgi:alkylated DNA repair protein (DNA oxidative demethylase)